MSVFKDKTLLITGGTGSFGNAVLRRFLNTDIKEIRIFSRDEKKQDDMRHEYQVRYPEVAHKIKFFIGDVRSLESCRGVMPGVDYIFHAAALKQVPSCEFFPMEATRTNVEGTNNVLLSAIENGVKNVVPCDTRDLNYDKFFTEGNEEVSKIEDYHSHNTRRLDVEGMKEQLMRLRFIQADLGMIDADTKREIRSE